MLSLLITISPIFVDPHVCTEIYYELERGVEERVITQQQADRIFDTCMRNTPKAAD